MVHAERPGCSTTFRATCAPRPGSAAPVEVEVRDSTGDRTFQVRARAEVDDAGEVAVRVLRHRPGRHPVPRRRAPREPGPAAVRRRAAGGPAGHLGVERGDRRVHLVVDALRAVRRRARHRRSPTRRTSSLVHPDDRGWVDQRWRELATDGRPVEAEHRVIRPDGTRRVFRCRGAAAGPRRPDHDRHRAGRHRAAVHRDPDDALQPAVQRPGGDRAGRHRRCSTSPSAWSTPTRRCAGCSRSTSSGCAARPPTQLTHPSDRAKPLLTTHDARGRGGQAAVRGRASGCWSPRRASRCTASWASPSPWPTTGSGSGWWCSPTSPTAAGPPNGCATRPPTTS